MKLPAFREATMPGDGVAGSNDAATGLGIPTVGTQNSCIGDLTSCRETRNLPAVNDSMSKATRTTVDSHDGLSPMANSLEAIFLRAAFSV